MIEKTNSWHHKIRCFFSYKKAGYSYIRSEICLSHFPMLLGMVKSITYCRDRKENQRSNRFTVSPSFYTASLCAPAPHRKLYRKQSLLSVFQWQFQPQLNLDHTLHTHKLQLEAEGKKGFATEESKKQVLAKKE